MRAGPLGSSVCSTCGLEVVLDPGLGIQMDLNSKPPLCLLLAGGLWGTDLTSMPQFPHLSIGITISVLPQDQGNFSCAAGMVVEALTIANDRHAAGLWFSVAQRQSLKGGSLLLDSSLYHGYFLELSHLRVRTFQHPVNLGAEPSAKQGVGDPTWELGLSCLLHGKVLG